ncbi:MAG: dockerin type I domain-containing protein, partial [Oscillospiraceae bacterium]|nr:dockerin type I domain-containing protein [Oscillospiraceae bacterium]
GPANIIIRIPEKGIEETLPVWVNMPSEKSYILISPAAANISKGGVLQFTAVESDDGTPANVIWSVSGNKSSGTVINTNGLLTVDENETAEVLTVTAVCADDYSRYSNVTVNIISNQTTILPGDVNGDDKVDMADLVALARHIAGLETITPALLPAADTNRDNRVNIADLIRLARYLAGVDSSPLG